MKQKVIVSVKKPSNAGGAEIVWENLRKMGMNFENVSLDNKELPKFYKITPNIFHLKEIFASKWLMKKARIQKSEIIIYDKIFGWPKIKTNAKKICYNHGSYTLAGLTFKKKNKFVYLFYKYLISYFEKKSYENADKIVAVSESVKKEMTDYFKIHSKKIIVINNAVDLKKFKSIKSKNKLRKKYNLPTNKKIIFFPGRASFGKGFDIAEKVLEKLGEDYFMFVLGEGKSKLKNIKFLGKILNEKMPEIYNCADLCLFPSRYEGNSISVLESAACGIPLILSRVGLIKTEKIPEDYIGKNSQDYAQKIKNILEKKDELKKAQTFWKNFAKKYPLKKQVKELNEFLKNLK